jgi:serine/threonine protein kinase
MWFEMWLVFNKMSDYFICKEVVSYTVQHAKLSPEFRRIHRIADEEVALKTIILPPVQPYGHPSNMSLAIRILEKCKHPNIVELLSATRQSRLCVITTKWASFGSLRTALRSGKITKDNIPDIYSQMLSVIEYLNAKFHKRHWEIDEDHILISESGVVKFSGFPMSNDYVPSKIPEILQLTQMLERIAGPGAAV